jgi:TonB family protein
MSLIEWLGRASLMLTLLIPTAWLISALLRRLITARLAYAAWLLPLLALLPNAWISPATLVMPTLEVGPALASAWPSGSTSNPGSHDLWWLLLWALGAVAVSLRLIRVQGGVRNRIGGRTLDQAERADRGLDRWPGWLPVIASGATRGPLLLGSLPPKLVVPVSPERLHPWILAHERAHCRHGDPIWNLLLAVAGAVFWFHPLVHLAAWRIKRDQELAADEAVTASLPIQQRRAYGQLLLNQAVNPSAGLSLSWKSTHPIKERIMMTLKTAPGPSRRITALGLLGFGLVLGIGLVAQADTGGAATQASESAAEANQPQAVVRVPPQYPRQAAADGVEGSVTLEAEVGEDGSVHSVRVVASEPSGVFDQVAVAAFSQWRFDPTQGGRHDLGGGLSSDALTVRQTIDFRLD